FPMSWNGRPITIDHPYVVDSANDGIIRVSANTSPEVLENFQIGFIFNTKLDGTKLTMEAWIDQVKANMHSDAARTLLGKIKKGERIEVSTGLFTGSEQTKGVYNEREYFGVWRGVVPDHLALLPDGLVGACSNEDGCGVNVNSASTADPSGKDALIRVHRLRASCSCDSGAGAPSVTLPSPSATSPSTPGSTGT